VVPPRYAAALEQVPTWDEWDPDTDRWYYDWQRYAQNLRQEGIS
jgi:hypothetical protein